MRGRGCPVDRTDPLSPTLHRALDAKPNAGYLMNRDGSVAFRTLWSNDEAILREGLQAVLQGRTAGERQPRLVPMVKGMGSMDEVLGLAGQQARRDVRRGSRPCT